MRGIHGYKVPSKYTRKLLKIQYLAHRGSKYYKITSSKSHSSRGFPTIPRVSLDFLKKISFHFVEFSLKKLFNI
jgi:hypothetical protein